MGTRAQGVQWQQLKAYRNPDLADVPIYHFDVVTPQLRQREGSNVLAADDWILLHTKDNMVRLCALQQTIVRVMSEFPVKNSQFGCRGVISPSGEYIVIGCETGKVFVFSSDGNCEPIACDLSNARLGAPVCDIVWSRRHHLLAFSGYEADEPPIVVFYAPREGFEEDSFKPPERVQLGDTRASLTSTDINLQGRLSSTAEQWAMNWMDMGSGGPLGLKKKQELKASVIGAVYEEKTQVELRASLSRRTGGD